MSDQERLSVSPSPFVRRAENEKDAREQQQQAEERLRVDYTRTFTSEHGKRVLEDLIDRFDPVLTEVPANGDAAMFLAAVRRVMNHVREMTGAAYANAMARVDERSRRGE